MPRDRHVSPSGAHTATKPRIMYCRGVGLICDISLLTRPYESRRNEEKGGRNSAALDERYADEDYAPAPTVAGGSACLAARFLHHLVALRAELQERLGLNVEPRNIAIHDRLPDHAERSLGTEVILVVEAVHHLHARNRWAGRGTRCAPSGGRRRLPSCSLVMKPLALA